jgi:hypothetical protein
MWQDLWFQYNGAPALCGESVRQRLNKDGELTVEAHCMTSSVALCTSDRFLFPVGLSGGAHLCNSSYEQRRFHGKILSSCDNG